MIEVALLGLVTWAIHRDGDHQVVRRRYARPRAQRTPRRVQTGWETQTQANGRIISVPHYEYR